MAKMGEITCSLNHGSVRVKWVNIHESTIKTINNGGGEPNFILDRKAKQAKNKTKPKKQHFSFLGIQNLVFVEILLTLITAHINYCVTTSSLN